jgi:hypothetical protein
MEHFVQYRKDLLYVLLIPFFGYYHSCVINKICDPGTLLWIEFRLGRISVLVPEMLPKPISQVVPSPPFRV